MTERIGVPDQSGWSARPRSHLLVPESAELFVPDRASGELDETERVLIQLRPRGRNTPGRPPSQEARSRPHVRHRRRWWTAGDVALVVLVVLAVPVLSLLALVDVAAERLIAIARRWT